MPQLPIGTQESGTSKAGCRFTGPSVTAAGKDPPHGNNQQLQVQSQAHIAKVKQIVAKLVGGVISAVKYLGKTGHSRQNLQTLVKARNLLHQPFMDPVHATVDQLADALDADPGLHASMGEEREDWLDLILSTKVTPTFSTNELTVLQHYPSSQAALARLCPADSNVADRFEIFFGSIELANGYVELTNVNEQSMRIAPDQENRKNRRRAVRPIDPQLLAALEAGLPASAGVAMGLERLQMTFDKTHDIRDVVTFAFEDRHQ